MLDFFVNIPLLFDEKRLRFKAKYVYIRKYSSLISR